MVELFQRLRISVVLRSVCWQMLGSAATLCTAFWISWDHGLEAQGEFGLAKSWFDATAAIAALGLPHGLLHLMYRCGISPNQLLPWMRGILVVAATLCWPAAGATAALGQQTAALVLASLPFALAHLLARSWLLRALGEEVFGIVTAMPAFVLLAAVLIVTQHYPWLLLATTAIAGTTSLSMVAYTARREQTTSNVTMRSNQLTVPHHKAEGGKFVEALPHSLRRQLWTSSLQIWMQAALGSALPAGLLSVVAQSGQAQRALGEASLGLHVYQVFAVLAGYVAPLLFHRIAGHRTRSPLDATALSSRNRRVLWIVGGSLLLVMLGGIALQPDALWPAIGLMTLAGIVAVAARLHSTVLLARSQYRELSLQAAARLLLASLVTLLTLQFVPALIAISAALLLTEGLTWWHSAHRAAMTKAT